MRLKLYFIFLSVWLSITGILLIPAASLAQELPPFAGLVNEEGVNIRSDSTVGASIICVAEKGLRLDVVAANYDWYKVRLPKQAPAYVSKELVECVDSDKGCASGKILKDGVNIRLEPHLSSHILGKVDQNQAVTIISESQDWYKILPIQNSYGWIHKKFISKALPEEPVEVAEKPKVEPPASEPVVLEGVIRAHGFFFTGVASHKLITEDKKIFLLKGDKAALKALNLRKAKITGHFLGEADQKYPTVEVKILEALD
ncbi:MAG: SH3 domain-containing protein [Candidatus Omnitrophota bacterium]